MTQNQHEVPLYEQFGAPTILYPHSYYVSRTNPIKNDDTEYIRARVLKDDIDHHLFRGKPDIARLKNTDEAYQSLPKEFKEGVDYFDSLNKGWNQFWNETKQCEPRDYGNCLHILKCYTTSDKYTNNDTRNNASIMIPFLVHPTGRLLDCLSVTQLLLPARNSQNIPNQQKSDGKNNLNELYYNVTGVATLPIGERILQIVPSGAQHSNSSYHSSSLSRYYEYYFVIRTKSRHTLIRCIISFHVEDVFCNIQLKEICQIPQQKSIETLDCTAFSYPDVSSSYDTLLDQTMISPISFSFLEKEHSGNKSNNYFYNVLYHNSSHMITQKHEFSSIANLKLIQATSHPCLLWSAASSIHAPYGRRSASSSLYRLDIRCNSSSGFAFSPSNSSYFIEGAVGITGICCVQPNTSSNQQPNQSAYTYDYEHSLYVSTNMREIIELDGRMPGPVRVMATWGLIGNTEGKQGSDVGNDLLQLIYEENMMDVAPDKNFHKSALPSSLYEEKRKSSVEEEKKHPFLLGLSQKKGVFGFGLYQKGSVEPRFGTIPLETGAASDAILFQNGEGFSGGSILRSSLFPLVDSLHANIFHCGLASLSIQLDDPEFIPNFDPSFQKELESSYLPYNSNACIVFTMTNMGNIYCHTLLPCNRSMKRKSIPFANLPHGSRAIAIPTNCCTQSDDIFENQDDYVTIMDKTISSFIQNHQNGSTETIKSDKNSTNKSIPNYLRISLCNRYPQPGATTCFPEEAPYFNFYKRIKSNHVKLDIQNLTPHEKETSVEAVDETIDKSEMKSKQMILDLLREMPRSIHEINTLLRKKGLVLDNHYFECHEDIDKWLDTNDENSKSILCHENQDLKVTCSNPVSFPKAMKIGNNKDKEMPKVRKIHHPIIGDGIGCIHIETKNATVEQTKSQNSQSSNEIEVPTAHFSIAHSIEYVNKLREPSLFDIEQNGTLDPADLIISENSNSDVSISNLAKFGTHWDEFMSNEYNETTKREEEENH